MHPFAPRPVRPLASVTRGGWRLKRYAITHDPATEPDLARFSDGVARALAELPRPAVSGERPCVGFVILHHGRGADYVVLGWWDRANELPLRVFLRPDGYLARRLRIDVPAGDRAAPALALALVDGEG